MSAAFDLTPSRPLMPADAVAAVIRTHDRRYLLQLRDAVPTIFYPDHWGCFGGAMDRGESPMETLRRELREELSVDVGAYPTKFFGRFQFGAEGAGIAPFDRYYYEVIVDPGSIAQMRLGEGAGMDLVDGREALHRLRLVPYDAFALWLHYYQEMLGRG